MLIIGQPDKMLTDLRSSTGRGELSAMSMWIPVSADNINVSNNVFSLRMSECLPRVQDTAMSLLHCSPSTQLMQPSITSRLVILLLNAAFRQAVP
jgi:hypothetical protein